MAIQIEKLSDTKLWIHDGATSLMEIDTTKGVNIPSLMMGLQNVPSTPAAAYKLVHGVAAVTGTLTVVTGLKTIVSVQATSQDDLDGGTLAGVSATVGNQSGAPAAGSIILKCWKVTTGGAGGNPTLIAATAAKNVNWFCLGT
jgi:hypothetical protein